MKLGQKEDGSYIKIVRDKIYFDKRYQKEYLYSGQSDENGPNGIGRACFDDCIFEGQFTQTKRFEGAVPYPILHGFGRMVCKNGSYYIGHWRKFPCGYGKWNQWDDIRDEFVVREGLWFNKEFISAGEFN